MRLSTFILKNIEPILVEWENFARTLFINEESKTTLRDDAKGMLLVIAQDLQQEQSKLEQSAKSKGQQASAKNETAAEKHGVGRMNDGLNIQELASEYRALRASVTKLWGNGSKKINPSDINDLIRFNEAIDQSLSESLDSYASSKEHQSRQFNTMLSSSPDISFVIDTKGVLLYVNRAMSELYQQPIHYMIGKFIYDLSKNLMPEEQIRFQSVLDTGEPCRGDKIFIDHSGRTYFFEFIYTPIFDDNKKIEAISGNLRDITERKFAEKKLISTLYERDQVNKKLESFAYVVSHDLKAPLRGVITLAGWIKEDGDNQLTVTSKENLVLLQSRVKRMSNLIDRILEYAQAGGVDQSLASVNIKTLLKEVIDNLAPSKAFKFQYAKNFPTLQTRETPLYQVFSNLISNAIKYSKKGCIKIGVEDKGEFYEFFVADNGPGIEEKYFEKIFQMFQTVEDVAQEDSTGIGLSIVKTIVEANHGKIWVESKLGQGTTFSFTWPKDIEAFSLPIPGN